MKEIIIKNKNGITLKTAGTIVQEDIKLTLDSSLSPSYENGDNLTWGVVNEVKGYIVSFQEKQTVNPNTTFYSIDNGLTWNSLYYIPFNQAIENITQIKFKIASPSGVASISSQLLNLTLTTGESANYILTTNIDDLIVRESTSGGEI